MTSQIHFPNAPITEALLDIRVVLPNNTDINKLVEFQNKIKKNYPNKQVKVEWKASFKFKDGNRPQMVNEHGQTNGYLFYSPDKKKLVQARLDGFTFNKLRPYSNWSDFSNEAKELWEHYKQIANPIKIIRLGLRYINRIEIPLPINSLDDYLSTKPVVCPDMPMTLENFLMRVNFAPSPENPNNAIVLETIDTKQNPQKVVPIILDIDVFRKIDIDPNKDQKMWEIFSQLREYKNSLFINSITNKTKKLFQ